MSVGLLAEHETTPLIRMVSEIGERMQVPAAQHPELDKLKQNLRPEQVLRTMEDR
jgi:hypothetical protein